MMPLRWCMAVSYTHLDEFYPDDEEIEIEKDEDGTYMCPVCGLYYDTEAEARECCSTEKLYKCQSCGHVYTEEELSLIHILKNPRANI